MASMTDLDSHVALLRKQIAATEIQVASLKQQLSQAENRIETTRLLNASYQGGFPAEWIGEISSVLTDNLLGTELYPASVASGGSAEGIAMNIRQETGIEGREFVTPESVNNGRWPLLSEEYKRYGRQMIMQEVGLHGQLRLKTARVLVVGVGGLGCPAAAYLAGAGVGTLGLMDGDVVEISNLHRQVAHNASRVGMSKVDSVYDYLSELNPLVKYQRHHFHLTPEKAIPIFSQYDFVLDCTDHPTSRYLISDACVLTGKPLVSASALKTEGQLIVLNNPPRPPGDSAGGPCYRCVFPKPPPADSVLSCGEGGVLGPVVGVMGILQALETIKLITAKPDNLNKGTIDLVALMSLPPSPSLQPQEPPKPTMTIFSAFSTPQFRSVRMRTRRQDCACCSNQATITRNHLNSGSLDYQAFCGLRNPLKILPPTSRISAKDFARLPRDGSNALIDVRDETQYQMCALRGSLNVPWKGSAQAWLQKAFEVGALPNGQGSSDYYIVCREGNDSQLAAKAIYDLLQQNGGESSVRVKDIKGGFRSWREQVDRDWPDY